VVSVCFCIVLASIILGVCDEVHAWQGGYDENTEIAIKGKILQILHQPYKGFHCFILQAKTRRYLVLTAPQWFLKRAGIHFEKGNLVNVVGSKFFGSDGRRCLLVRSVTFIPSGEKILFRDNALKPVWYGVRRPESSCMRIFYTPSSH